VVYFVGTCSLALSLVFLGAACGDFNSSSNCATIEECPCNDGTTQPTNCTTVTLCTQACSGNGGFDAPPAVDGGDGG
jgi:hypothetical protein